MKVLNDTGTGTITDNDIAIFTINDQTVDEAAGILTFTISLSNPVDTAVVIDIRYTDVTTTAVDFDHDADQVIFAAFDIADKTVTVAIADDSIVEKHSETFTASLSTATALGTRMTDMNDIGWGRILDNDQISQLGLVVLGFIESFTEQISDWGGTIISLDDFLDFAEQIAIGAPNGQVVQVDSGAAFALQSSLDDLVILPAGSGEQAQLTVDLPISSERTAILASLFGHNAQALGCPTMSMGIDGQELTALTLSSEQMAALISAFGDNVHTLRCLTINMSSDGQELTALDNAEMMLLSFNLPTDVNIPPGATISIVYWNEQYSRWVELETNTTQAGRVVAATNHFGTFAVIIR